MISKRAGAFFLDSLLATIPFYIYVGFFQHKTVHADAMFCGGFAVLFLWVTCYLYFVIQEYYWQRTIGKRILKLRVAKMDNSKLTFSDILKRHFFDFIELVTLPFLAIIFIISNPLGQRLGDKLAKTRVVSDEKLTEPRKDYSYQAIINKRTYAYLIDFLITLIPFSIYFEVFKQKNAHGEYYVAGSRAILFFLVTYSLYFVIQEYKWHQTIGKRILDIKVVRMDHNKLTLPDIVKRHLFDFIEFIVILPAALIIACVTKKNQRLGDLIANTLVVSVTDSKDD